MSQKLKALDFLEKLEKLVKNYNPIDFAVLTSRELNKCMDDFKKGKISPCHFLLYAIEANCKYHRTYKNDEFTKTKLAKVIKHYIQYYDPVASYLLGLEEGVMPFMINIARQQFYVNQIYGGDDLGRAISIFINPAFKKSRIKFKETYGVSFSEWIFMCFSLYAAVESRGDLKMSIDYYLGSKEKILDDQAVVNIMNKLSIKPECISETVKTQRAKLHEDITIQFETYIESIFTKYPLLKFDDKRYLVVHKHFLLRQATEGIYDLMKEITNGGAFGNEFGKAFERYIEELLLYYFSKDHVFSEVELKKYGNGKVCDFIVEFDNCLMLIECKGTEYKSVIATEGAMKGDNSTKTINRAIEQLIEVERKCKNGVFESLLNNANKPILKIVVTYKHIYFVNSKWYRENIIDFKYDKSDEFVHPEVMSVNEFEKLLFKITRMDLNPVSLITYRNDNDSEGDWINILYDDSYQMPLLNERFDEFSESMINKARQLKN